MAFRSFFILFAFLLAPVPDPGPEVVAQDTKQIQGTWELVDVVENGKSTLKEIPPGFKMIFDGEKLRIHFGQERKKVVAFKLDQTKKPKVIDLIPEGNDPGAPGPGIYQLNGDRLLLCFTGRRNQERPTEFASPEGSDRILFTLKRKAK